MSETNPLCIFCKAISTNSKSIEHIIPESLGNVEHILPKGIVCDDCNQYFGRKIEKELLDQSFFQHVRHRQFVPTKRGNAVSWKAFSLFPVSDPERFLKKPKMAQDEMISEMLKQGNMFYSPFINEPRKDNIIISRFLAKVALEALTNICLQAGYPLSEIVDNDSLDPLRKYARYGAVKTWPYNMRKIYEENKTWSDDKDPSFQLLHEYRTFSILKDEYYFVLAIFGVEFVINYSNENLDSFIKWLEINNGMSPLYSQFQGETIND